MTFALYMIKVSVCLGVFYILYISVFERYTFFKVNRYYLLSTLFVSFVIPGLQFSLFKDHYGTVHLNSIGEAFYEPLYLISNLAEQKSTTGIDYPEIWTIIYFMGVGVMFFRLVFFIARLIRIKNNAEQQVINTLRIVKTELPQPFSFFNWVFLPKHKIDPIIISHEKAHVTQLHWIDLLLAEVACMLLWLNPVAFLYKRSIKLQHEYLADSCTINGGVDIQHYLQCMLAQLKLENRIGLTSQFYSQSIKRRILMLTKTKTALKFSGAYLLFIPATSMLLLAFSNQQEVPFSKVLQTTVTVGGQNIPSIAPVDVAKVTRISVYGDRMHPIFKKVRFHTGIDFEMTAGEPVKSTADGTVVKMIDDSGRGIYVIIKHNDRYSTSYSHLQSSVVKEGGVVTQGQVIGYVGSTGISVGPHLHYEVMMNGEFVDPKDYLPKIEVPTIK